MISGHFLRTLSNPLDNEPVMNGYLKRHEETISPGSITVHFGYSYCREEGASICSGGQGDNTRVYRKDGLFLNIT